MPLNSSQTTLGSLSCWIIYSSSDKLLESGGIMLYFGCISTCIRSADESFSTHASLHHRAPTTVLHCQGYTFPMAILWLQIKHAWNPFGLKVILISQRMCSPYANSLLLMVYSETPFCRFDFF